MDQIPAYLDDVEKRCKEYRRFQSLGGKIPLCAEHLSDIGRLAAIDVLELVALCRMMMAERSNDKDHR
ncbi:MAG: hypothetical protein IH623_11535 [Verrucomicrobia bacterium]|nr:hypothetical protein [Verrucomicrobiota bacterium]